MFSAQKSATELLETSGAMRQGHFVYASGLHGGTYVDKDALYAHPRDIAEICRKLAYEFRGTGVQAVVGPAIGGVVLSHLVAAELCKYFLEPEVISAYAEKDGRGGYVLRRGFDTIIRSLNVLVVEDILTTGGTAAKVIQAVQGAGGNVIGLTAIANRGKVTAETVGVSVLKTLISLNLQAWREEECPFCAAQVPIDTQYGKGAEFLARRR